jgi:hypothetical protein
MTCFQSPVQRERSVATSAATPSGSAAMDEEVSVVEAVVVKGAGGGRVGRMDETAAPAPVAGRRTRARRSIFGYERGCDGLFVSCDVFWPHGYCLLHPQA